MNRKRIGYTSPYLPPEIIWACGLTPVRLRPGAGLDAADGYLPRNFSVEARALLAAALEGQTALDAAVFLDEDDTSRRLFDVWCAHAQIPTLDLIPLPRLNTARALQLELGQLGVISAQATRDVPISSICTVFAESEVITLVAEGVERADIVAGLHRAIVRRVSAMVKRVGANPVIAFGGGVAKNPGVKRALEQSLGERLLVPPEPQIVGALGAALIAGEGRA